MPDVNGWNSFWLALKMCIREVRDLRHTDYKPLQRQYHAWMARKALGLL